MSESEYRELIRDASRVLAQQQKIITYGLLAFGVVLLGILSAGMAYRETVDNNHAEFKAFEAKVERFKADQLKVNDALLGAIEEASKEAR